MRAEVGRRFLINGNLYEVTRVDVTGEAGRIELTPRSRSSEWEREMREFATDNRKDPEAVLAVNRHRPMYVDEPWFRRPDVKEVTDG